MIFQGLPSEGDEENVWAYLARSAPTAKRSKQLFSGRAFGGPL